MTKTRVVHRCQQCGATTPRWLGKCPDCGEWGSLVEELEVAVVLGVRPALAIPADAPRPVPIAEIVAGETERRPTGVGEFDRVLGGGLVAGSVTLLGGEPGVGKSTLLLQALSHLAQSGSRCLLVSAEESKDQVRMRAERLGTLAPGLWLLTETVLPRVLAHAEQSQPDVLAIDSIQTVYDPDLPSAPGSVGQVRECAHQLVRRAKDTGVATILVGHVTKEGTIAGPRVLEHIVDTVLSFEGERHHALRILRASKHRFGSTDEMGLFEMDTTGLVGVPDPSALFLADRRSGVSGSVVTAILDGSRPLLVEVQALVPGAEKGQFATRSAQGFDTRRLSLLLGVLEARASIKLGTHDVYVGVAGGVKVTETGADLGVCLALASAAQGRAVPDGTVVVGEVGLGGEIRQAAQTARRLAEAARLGFQRAIVPATAPDVAGITTVRARTLTDAITAAGVAS